MLFNRRRVRIRPAEELTEGESLKIIEKMEDRDLLLYLGLTNDSNPLYIQHDFTAAAGYDRPVVPATMLTGIVTAAVSRHLPGPGSRVLEQQFKFPEPAWHGSTVTFDLVLAEVDLFSRTARVRVEAEDENLRKVMAGELLAEIPSMAEENTEITALDAADGGMVEHETNSRRR
ncbi:Acyl dehydratase [Bhargavaea ginsengi]|uniref:Acyl dehydratase n=1 Tax=Bhargavaea ginsengi TaxID=426757 RepID=A0A1H6Y3C0_9BACL|nr:MaoC/PaaZ C-terminal domain-containing protein [Bhargavaea ginsengi]MCM3086405.1 MaoC family dehydratase N-terminal domain-containing protein [Bhargavaea ginsengi]SEJ31652.1 Acyl dehydratase [Bhargavaea ginsengi]